MKRGHVALALAVLTASSARGSVVPVDQRKDAPSFSLSDSEGKPVTMAGLKGKIVLVNFWATWCGGCQTEIPWFVEFGKKYRESGLAVVGISMDDDGWKAVRPDLKARHLSDHVVIGDPKLAKAYGVRAMARTVLVDRDGKVAAAYDGVVPREDFERDLQGLLDTGKKSRP